jgi:hypothetical protein
MHAELAVDHLDWEYLPHPVFELIVAYLDRLSLGCMQLTCKAWYESTGTTLSTLNPAILHADKIVDRFANIAYLDLKKTDGIYEYCLILLLRLYKLQELRLSSRPPNKVLLSFPGQQATLRIIGMIMAYHSYYRIYHLHL